MTHIQTQAAKQRYLDYGISEVEVWSDEDERRCMVFAIEMVESEHSLSQPKVNVVLSRMIIGKRRKKHLGGKDDGG